MLTRLCGNSMELIFLQFSNAQLPMASMLCGSVTTVRERQLRKVASSMAVIPWGNSMLVNAEQPSKADRPMLMMFSGRVTSVRDSQWKKASAPMYVNPAGKVMLFSCVHVLNAPSSMVLIPAGSVISLKDAPLNAFSPMALTGTPSTEAGTLSDATSPR